MERTGDALTIGYDRTNENDVSSIVVARIQSNNVYVLNQYLNEDAEMLYKILTEANYLKSLKQITMDQVRKAFGQITKELPEKTYLRKDVKLILLEVIETLEKEVTK